MPPGTPVLSDKRPPRVDWLFYAFAHVQGGPKKVKKIENPLTFDKVMIVSLVAYFFGPPCTSLSHKLL